MDFSPLSDRDRLVQLEMKDTLDLPSQLHTLDLNTVAKMLISAFTGEGEVTNGIHAISSQMM